MSVKWCINWFVVCSFLQLPITIALILDQTNIATFYEQILLFLILEKLHAMVFNVYTGKQNLENKAFVLQDSTARSLQNHFAVLALQS